MINLVEFQKEKVQELLNLSVKNLNSNNRPKTIIFQSPTGSGKTIMASELIKELYKNEKNISFIWIAPRNLYEQSKIKLQKYLSSSPSITHSYFNDLDKHIKSGEILYMNWESINKKDKNIIVQESEKNFFLQKIVENTIEEGNRIVLLIDESHHGAKSDISLSLIRSMMPSLTIEISATPKLLELEPGSVEYDIVKAHLAEVKEANLIKNLIVLNDGVGIKATKNQKKVEILEDFTNEQVIKRALKKRNELEKGFLDEKSNVKPLLLIQLPDSQRGSNSDMKEEVLEILNKNKLTTENKKVAIYLSEENLNIDEEKQPFESVEVLIFKQAIALGWDCPRAHILAIFRDIKSFSFEVQTIGRICRFPEPDRGYFKNNELNDAYIFSNIPSIDLKDNFAQSLISLQVSERKRGGIYDPVNLHSYHTIRNREKTRFDLNFEDLFAKTSSKLGISKKIKINNLSVKSTILKDTIESVQNIADSLEHKDIELSDPKNLQRYFDVYINKTISNNGFFPEQRSVDRVKNSIYKFCETNFSLNKTNREDQLKIMKIVLDDRNNMYFNELAEKTINEYSKYSEENETVRLGFDGQWNVPERIHLSSFGDSLQKSKSRKSIMQPFLVEAKLYESEKKFIEYLEKSDEVKWWFRNGDRDMTYFAVPYEKENSKAPFYVDFIVFYKDNEVGLYDTKMGITLQTEDTVIKNKGLQNYLKNEKYKKFKLHGGIVSNTNKDYSGNWKIYKSTNQKNIMDTKKKGWELLDFKKIR